jgi:hypothetical protein
VRRRRPAPGGMLAARSAVPLHKQHGRPHCASVAQDQTGWLQTSPRWWDERCCWYARPALQAHECKLQQRAAGAPPSAVATRLVVAVVAVGKGGRGAGGGSSGELLFATAGKVMAKLLS